MGTKDVSLISLVESFQDSRSPEIWGEIYRRYYQRVYRYGLKMGVGHEDALDLSQDILLKMYYRISTLNSSASFESWLFRMTRNACINHLKEKSRHKVEPIESIPVESAIETEENLLRREEDAQERHERMIAILADLPSETRNMVELKYRENYPVKALKEIFNLKESAVKMRLLRAKRQMRTAYLHLPVILPDKRGQTSDHFNIRL